MCPEPILSKRLWHFEKYFGEALSLVCERSNERMRRKLAKCESEDYKRIWKPLVPGPRLWTFLAAWIGSAILKKGASHLMKKEPAWISQLGEGHLFEKLPTNLFRMWRSCFVGHSHRDTILFRKSIMEQRKRYYGTNDFSKIVYSQARLARDPPPFMSGDETITRMYGRKATDVRMRTSKKNESGILNQNLCSSNHGYEFRQEGDPEGGGYTFANLIYPGKSYSVGSTVREKDIGNLMQLIFQCGDYFRYRDIELIVDSHFGHITHIAYLRT